MCVYAHIYMCACVYMRHTKPELQYERNNSCEVCKHTETRRDGKCSGEPQFQFVCGSGLCVIVHVYRYGVAYYSNA